MMVPSVEELTQALGPFAAFVVATFDRSGLPLIVGAVCVAVGIADGSQPATIALGTAGMIVGDLTLYEIGRQGGSRTAFARRFLRPLKPLRSTARAILRRYPTGSLVFGRYVAGAGILIPILAGGFGMARRRAYALLVLGSVLYVIPWGVLAFQLGRRFDPIVEEVVGNVVWFAVAGLVGAVAWLAYSRVQRQARKAQLHRRQGRDAS